MTDGGTMLWVFFAVGSALSVAVTVYDKWAATHRPRHRIRERTLLCLAGCGGAAAMYITMRLIRHKTLHMRFMLGLPVLFILQCAALGFLLYKTGKGDWIWLPSWLL